MNTYFKNCLSDFANFIDFVERERPILSVKLGVFGKPDCFKLNSLLSCPKQPPNENYRQAQYPVIDLMFDLALLGGLYVKANDDRGKFALVKTPKLESYNSFNEYEKYVFLLQTYWTRYDFKNKFISWIRITSFYNLLVTIAQAEEGQKVVNSNQRGASQLYSEGAEFFHHLNYFCLGNLDLFDDVKGRHQESIKAFTPNKFGKKIIIFLLTKVLQFWNKEDLDILRFCGIAIPEKTDKPFDIFKNIFENNVVALTIDPTEVGKTGVYCFKVGLSKRVWRKINLSHKHTLADFHNAIQEAFDFNNDHLYGFFVGGNERNGKPIYCEDAGDGEITAEEMEIGDLKLYEGAQMLYLFDFGAEWKFNVELLQINEAAPLPIEPEIIESKGESPDQYREEW